MKIRHLTDLVELSDNERVIPLSHIVESWYLQPERQDSGLK